VSLTASARAHLGGGILGRVLGQPNRFIQNRKLFPDPDPRSTFADEAQRFAGFQREGDAVYRAGGAGVRAEFDLEVFDFEERHAVAHQYAGCSWFSGCPGHLTVFTL
jgi:hypothetical protein